MIFERENTKPVENPSEKQISYGLSHMKSYGKSSFATITDQAGNYLQIEGGKTFFLFEKRECSTGKHFRAYQQNPVVPFEDDTELCFSGGSIRLKRNEWFRREQVEETFISFSKGQELPIFISWTEIQLD